MTWHLIRPNGQGQYNATNSKEIDAGGHKVKVNKAKQGREEEALWHERLSVDGLAACSSEDIIYILGRVKEGYKASYADIVICYHH